MSEIRVLPLPRVTGIWEHDYSKYPDRIRVPMSDSSVQTYLLSVEMPHPALAAAIENINKMEGYSHERKGK